MRKQSRVVAWVAGVVVLTGACSEPPDEPDTGSDRVFSASPSDTESSASEPAPAPSEPSSDTRLADEADAMAELYGYTLPGSVGEGAALAETTCERALDGWDYETAVADDISVGAPRDAAVGWNTFVYDEFCPSLR